MEYRKLGKWGLRVSEIGLGSWLTYGNAVDEKNAAKQIHHAFEQGINFLDTANVYARGQAEVAVGKAIRSIKRDSLVLATKVFFPMGDGPNDRGLSRKHIFEQCHESLRRLQTDYIDLYQCHRFDVDVPLFELVRTMDDLTRQGKILYWGVSEWSAREIEQAVDIARSINAMPPVSNQPQYNMLARSIEDDVIPLCREKGIGQLVFSPLSQGVLTGKYKPDHPFPSDSRAADNQNNVFMVGRSLMARETLEMVQKLTSVAAELGVSMAQMALAWCLRLPEVSSVIMGATKLSQIDDNVKATTVKLRPEYLAAIDNILQTSVTSR